MGIQAGIVGASGFAGIELTRRLIEHPSFDLAVITSDADAGKPLAEVYPCFTGMSDLVFTQRDTPELQQCDVVFLAVPHTVALGIVPDLLAAGISVFDLSADYRLKNPTTYEHWYGVRHTSPELLPEAAFGLPELCPDEIERATQKHVAGDPVLVACAGCYPTASSLAAYPAVHADITTGMVNIQAVSGVTGAGRKATARTHYCAATENIEAYGASGHRHTPEIEQILGLPGQVVFVPHLAPLERGLLSTVTMQLKGHAAALYDVEKLQNLYEDFYHNSAFVSVLPAGEMPRTSSVVGTNRAHVGVAYQERRRTLIASCAIDNLGKGAADQAVQCANLVFGLPETEGLNTVAVPL
ncbi:MAG: N-acetyl-gamma-glutamyl-phosphate reductase [Eggerthellaceae bacterium]|jgi:N-acetyl-gamma-glutamyl-phosphate reductase|nr:N-acetyl-gamma-glutamyl-phosphate reductase [Eggerthellaceae bacterium]MCH4221505.1 N-acetyl-gamma-glutamyl-phosphate reductase [Eggerthellaceae bacterium]